MRQRLGNFIFAFLLQNIVSLTGNAVRYPNLFNIIIKPTKKILKWNDMEVSNMAVFNEDADKHRL